MRRREFITLLASSAATWPFATWAQQPAVPVIGFLSSVAPQSFLSFVAAFRDGLGEADFVEGKNVTIDYRWAEGHYDRLPALAADLVRRQVAVIIASGGQITAQTAKATTSKIPIVFLSGVDPIATGLVASLNRPEGNITGVTFFAAELSAKRLEILRQLVATTTLAVLINPSNPNKELEIKDAQAAARAGGQNILFLEVSGENDLATASASLAQSLPGALLVSSDPFLFALRSKIVALAAQFAIPAMYIERDYVVDGGLISYGASISDAYKQAEIYAAKILKGAKPADLPIVRPTKFELVINLRTAKALGLTIPATLLALADEVFE